MTLKEILARKAEIKSELETRSAELTSEEIDAFDVEVRNLETEEIELRKREELKEKVSKFEMPMKEEERKSDEGMNDTELRAKKLEGLKERGAKYKSLDGREVSIMERALSVEGTANAGVIVPSHTSSTVDRLPFNQVSSVIDVVDYISLPNGNEYTQAFQITADEGDYTLEPTKTGEIDADKDGVYHKVGTTFDKVTMKRNKITAIDYISEEMMDLPEADYAAVVEENVVKSIRKKVAKEIVLGDGTGNHFVGLLAASNINPNTYNDSTINAIDENTLSNIAIEYGGTEDIESNMYLMINKLTVKEFLKVRGADKRPVYTVSLNGNTATINGINVIFSSNIKSFDAAGAGEYWAVYGDFKKYKALDFGGTTADASKDFKFDQGLIAVRAKTYGGGAPAAYKAFTRIKKSEL